jgi:hypothetical protein
MTLFTRNIIVALGITIVLIGTILFTIAYLNNARVNNLANIADQISIDTLSLDTQFSLLETAPCDSATSSATLINSLTDLGNRLSYTENQLGSEDAQVIHLKQQYSLLEIRDYLITKRLATTCGTKPITVLYFYSNSSDCSDCDKAGYALSYLHNTYPMIRVYSFDYNLDLGALKTFIAINKVKPPFPSFVINGKQYNGFSTLEELEKKFPKGALSTSTTPIK